MEEFFISLMQTLENGKDAVIVGISAVSGSAPRGVGAKMLITNDGHVCGTIGGGSVEHEAELHAMALLKKKSSDMQSFRLAPNNIKDLGMICGGEVIIYFQYISDDNLNIVDIAKLALIKIEQGEESWLITEITATTSGQIGIYTKKAGFFGINATSDLSFLDTPHTQSENGREYLIEPLVRAGTVYIFGGGHVSQALVPLAAKAGFRCVVLDDRDEFTAPCLFPGAATVCKVNYNDIANTVIITENDYTVIMTRGHQYDSIIQAQAMRTKARYIGVMGSKSKIAHVSAQMRELGFTSVDLARVKTPIGLDIGAETAEEIAVSIVAELIMVRACR